MTKIVAEEMPSIPINVTSLSIAETYYKHFQEFIDTPFDEVNRIAEEILKSNKDTIKLKTILDELNSKYLRNHIGAGNEITEEWKLSELRHVLNRYLEFIK